MRTLPLQKRLGLWSAIAILAIGKNALAAPGNATVDMEIKPGINRPRSVFSDNPEAGKDPFFPESIRRRALVQVTSTNAITRASTRTFFLKGIYGSKLQPLAIINTSTVAVGESADIKCGREIVKLRCREIRERSVLVEVVNTGELQELKLREGI